ncbi:hypothetical protein [Aeromonas diversa]|uniref:hypothetical protein n=1 Tax=Aeromonas diversa TaxID=502790 RepID=UPI00346186FC
MNLVTTQQTSKRLKIQIAISYVGFIIGFLVIFILGPLSSDASMFKTGGIIMGLSLFWLLVTKIRIWWNHE